MIRAITRVFIAAALPAFVLLPAQQTGGTPSGPVREWWAHVTFLAGDKPLGRETGSEGERKAAEYVASEFRRAGLAAGGEAGYFQPVRFRARRIAVSPSNCPLGGAANPP